MSISPPRLGWSSSVALSSLCLLSETQLRAVCRRCLLCPGCLTPRPPQTSHFPGRAPPTGQTPASGPCAPIKLCAPLDCRPGPAKWQPTIYHNIFCPDSKSAFVSMLNFVSLRCQCAATDLTTPSCYHRAASWALNPHSLPHGGSSVSTGTVQAALVLSHLLARWLLATDTQSPLSE